MGGTLPLLTPPQRSSRVAGLVLQPPAISTLCPIELQSSAQPWREPSHHRAAPPPRGRAALEPLLTWLVQGPPLPVLSE